MRISALGIVAAFSTVAATCAADEGDRLMNFFSFFEGSWEVSESTGNVGVMKIEKGVSARCHILSYTAGDRTSDEICGYNRLTKKWTCIGYSANGDRYAYEMVDPPKREEVTLGDRWTSTLKGVAGDGKPMSSSAVFVVHGQDDYTVTITDRKVGGEKEEGIVLKFKRKK